MFLVMQKRVHYLRTITTELLGYASGTTCSCRREVSLHEFIIYSIKLKIIIKNIIQYDIKKGTSMECYMIGFVVFEPVV